MLGLPGWSVGPWRGAWRVRGVILGIFRRPYVELTGYGDSCRITTDAAVHINTKQCPEFRINSRSKLRDITTNGLPCLVLDFTLLLEGLLNWVRNLRIDSKLDRGNPELSGKIFKWIAQLCR